MSGEVPVRERWDGGSKYHTKDCARCGFHRKMAYDEMCGWGAAFKYLVRKEKERRCEVKDRKPVEYPSVEYLDRMIIVEKTVVIDGVKREVHAYMIRPKKFKRTISETSSDTASWNRMYQKD